MAHLATRKSVSVSTWSLLTLLVCPSAAPWLLQCSPTMPIGEKVDNHESAGAGGSSATAGAGGSSAIAGGAGVSGTGPVGSSNRGGRGGGEVHGNAEATGGGGNGGTAGSPTTLFIGETGGALAATAVRCGTTVCEQGQGCCVTTAQCIDPKQATCPPPAPTTVVCGGTTCPVGFVCCMTSGTCVDPRALAQSCPTPAPFHIVGLCASRASSQVPMRHVQCTDEMEASCGSNADCGDAEYCAVRDSGTGSCLGVGRCVQRFACDATDGPVCGCDGVTYASSQAACVAGVRIAGTGAGCGVAYTDNTFPGLASTVVACGQNDQCPAGGRCCATTGHCYDPATASCTPPQ